MRGTGVACSFAGARPGLDLYTASVKGPSRIVLIAGLLATVAVVLAGMAGLLNRIEWWTQDQRFLRARASAEPMCYRDRQVAINDRALDTISR